MKFTDTVEKLNESFGIDGKSCKERELEEIKEKALNENQKLEGEEPVPKDLDDENQKLEEEESFPKDIDDDEKLIRLIEKVLASPPEEFVSSPFIFENTKEAREHNSTILQDYDYDFKKCMNSIDISVIHPGSEFRDPKLLEPILKDHPDWPILKAIMKMGIDLGLDKDLKRDEET